MKLLAIDTATEACSVALWQDGSIIETFELLGREHSTRLPLMVPALLAEAGLGLRQIDGLVCGIGPGSFAGVRIGVSYVKGLALGLDRPVVGITSLAMLAQAALSANPGHTVLAAIDARMEEVYFGVYRASAAGLAEAVQADCVCAPNAIRTDAQGALTAVGSGWQAHGPALSAALSQAPETVDGTALPHARHALALAAPEFAAGRATDAALLLPAYLRNRVALTRIEQIAQRARIAAAKT
ncbi:MAG: tRNA (adenosine(37)-N6)-threonylcarbamoyltransferase complex dimerization subunit type 1 TsaB [Nevskia sp.]